jgi:prevent-host-death family protein
MSAEGVRVISATLSEARANFSKLVKRALDGETVVITSGRNRTPVARLEPLQSKTEKRLGALETPGFVLSPGFFQPLDEDELG